MVYPDDSAREGRSYELLINLANGKQYRSRPSVMPESSVKDHLRVELGTFIIPADESTNTQSSVRLARLHANSTVLNPDKDFYVRWDIYDTWMLVERLRIVPPGEPPPVPCYITNNISGQEIRIYNGQELQGDNIPERLLTSSTVDMRFSFNYFFHVVSSTFDRETYQYFERIQELTNLQGSIFDKPPAPVPGNLMNVNDPSERVLGYFQVVNSDTSRVKVTNDDVPWVITIPCPDRNRFNEPSFCTDCLLYDEKSTEHRPYYWY